VYDVQKKAPGGQWVDWMTGVKTTTVVFDSTGQPPGIYQFRSRLHRMSDNTFSDYSPGTNVTVTWSLPSGSRRPPARLVTVVPAPGAMDQPPRSPSPVV